MYLGLPNLGLNSYNAGGPALNLDFVSTETPDGRLTISGGAGGTRVDSSGTVVSASAPRFDYNPSTLAALGLLVEEQRTNSIRNNSMTGAVAGVARTIGTISGLSRSASTTVVVASTGHNVAVSDMITVSGANVAAYNGIYAVSAVVANVSYSYVVASSATDSATGYTVAVQSPGTIPTNWTLPNPIGLATTIVSTSSSAGILYIDLRIAGLPTGAGNTVRFETAGVVTASNGQVWTASAWTAIVGGSMTNISAISHALIERPALVSSTAAADTTATLTRGSLTRTLNQAGTTDIICGLNITTTSGQAIDITLRIGYPQLELGSFATSVIPTTSAAVTRTADSVTMTGANFTSWVNQTEGTLWAETQIIAYSTTANPNIVALYGTVAATDSIDVFLAGGGPNYRADITAGGVNTFLQNVVSVGNILDVNKFALAYQANNSVSYGRTTNVTDITVTLPTTTSLNLNVVSSGCSKYIRRLKFYSHRLSASELLSITS